MARLGSIFSATRNSTLGSWKDDAPGLGRPAGAASFARAAEVSTIVGDFFERRALPGGASAAIAMGSTTPSGPGGLSGEGFCGGGSASTNVSTMSSSRSKGSVATIA
jgi:hypothetical protein